MPDNTFFSWKTGILLELKDRGGDLKGDATLISSLKKTNHPETRSCSSGQILLIASFSH